MTQATRREEAQVRALPQYQICHHIPRCPAATAPDHDAARTVTTHPEQGWSLLCNGVVLFDDYGELLPDGHAVSPGQAADVPGHHERASVRGRGPGTTLCRG